MPEQVSIEEVQALAAKLSPPDQLLLIARMNDQLSKRASGFDGMREQEVQDILANLDAVAEATEGGFDSVQDIRDIRALG